MSSRSILRDVNLTEVRFQPGSADVDLSFANMSDGAIVGILTCNSLIVFSYCTFPGNTLPQYVGAVNVSEIDADTVRRALESAGYRLGTTEEPQGVFDRVVIEGWVTIEIICRRAVLN
jgi:hypothetical protein